VPSVEPLIAAIITDACAARFPIPDIQIARQQYGFFRSRFQQPQCMRQLLGAQVSGLAIARFEVRCGHEQRSARAKAAKAQKEHASFLSRIDDAYLRAQQAEPASVVHDRYAVLLKGPRLTSERLRRGHVEIVTQRIAKPF
jgi:hypothetical protein